MRSGMDEVPQPGVIRDTARQARAAYSADDYL